MRNCAGGAVVMGNLSSHKSRCVLDAIEEVGAEIRNLPQYSPDLNPIELAFSKFKKLLRDAAQRTTDKLWQLCGQVLDLTLQKATAETISTRRRPLKV